jgi:hypothetical protein
MHAPECMYVCMHVNIRIREYIKYLRMHACIYKKNTHLHMYVHTLLLSHTYSRTLGTHRWQAATSSSSHILSHTRHTPEASGNIVFLIDVHAHLLQQIEVLRPCVRSVVARCWSTCRGCGVGFTV